MLPILTPSESVALDRASAERGISILELMENAGRAVARAAASAAGGYGGRAVIVCGKGNNGGDGLVAARHLERAGVGVTVVLVPGRGELSGAAAENLARFDSSGGRWLPFSVEALRRALARADVAVDAVFGTGFHGVPEGPHAEAIRQLAGWGGRVVAVDIPSGVEGETGAARGPAVRADVTVTFAALKPGLVFFPGAGLGGRVEIADIGFPPGLVRSDLCLIEPRDAAAMLPVRGAEEHKRSTGVVLVVAGSRSMAGAAVLAATAAYRAGAGLVTVAAPESAVPVVQRALVEATFLPLPETAEGTLAESAWPLLEERLGGVHAAAIGPGLSRNAETAALVRRLVAACPVPFVLDADGLNAFAGRGSELADRRSNGVLTPHAGEFARLTGLSAAEVAEDRVGHARKAAGEFGCPVLLKGFRTVVAEPGGRAWVNPTGGPSLATGGTGDVLTGAVAAFIARGLDVARAGTLGAYVHGAAGDLAGFELGEGAVASDLLRLLPRVIQGLREETR